MRRLAGIALGALAGYALGAAVGFLLVTRSSPNPHDRSLEAVMTAFFAAGPAGAVIGGLAGALRRSREG